MANQIPEMAQLLSSSLSDRKTPVEGEWRPGRYIVPELGHINTPGWAQWRIYPDGTGQILDRANDRIVELQTHPTERAIRDSQLEGAIFNVGPDLRPGGGPFEGNSVLTALASCPKAIDQLSTEGRARIGEKWLEALQVAIKQDYRLGGMEDPWEFWFHHFNCFRHCPTGDWDWKGALRGYGTAGYSAHSLIGLMLKAGADLDISKTPNVSDWPLSPGFKASWATYEPGKLRAEANQG